MYLATARGAETMAQDALLPSLLSKGTPPPEIKKKSQKKLSTKNWKRLY
jgi:hypothetical protein